MVRVKKGIQKNTSGDLCGSPSFNRRVNCQMVNLHSKQGKAWVSRARCFRYHRNLSLAFFCLGGDSSFIFLPLCLFPSSVTLSGHRLFLSTRSKGGLRGNQPEELSLNYHPYHLETSFSDYVGLLYWPTNGKSMAMIACFFSIKSFWNLVFFFVWLLGLTNTLKETLLTLSCL